MRSTWTILLRQPAPWMLRYLAAMRRLTIEGSETCLTIPRVTDTNGVAVIEFEVSLKPGDNWRAVASCNPGELNGLRGKQNRAQLRVINPLGEFLPTADVKVSEVLTVWRRLHVEVDSMGLVANNAVSGQIMLVLEDEPIPGTSRVTISVTPALNDSVDRFKDGTLKDMPAVISQFEVAGRALVLPSTSITRLKHRPGFRRFHSLG